MENEIPRRNRLDLNTPAELAIHNAIGEIEKMGVDPILTDIQVELIKLKGRLADYVDLKIKDNQIAWKNWVLNNNTLESIMK
jgi:hypothetical protein